MVRNLIDDVQSAAQTRAENAAAKSNAFINSGALTGKPQETRFASALDLGSAGAYSAIIGSKGMPNNAWQQIAVNTKMNADASVQSLVVLKEINKSLLFQGVGGNMATALGKI